MNTAGSGGRLICEHVIRHTSYYASTIEKSWLSDAESTVLNITFPITKDLTPVAPFVAATAICATGLSGCICLGSACYKLSG
jgi:hypothetical protein